MGNFPAAKEDGNFDPVSFAEKALDMAKLKLEIMFLRAGSYLDLFHMDDGLMFPGLLDPFVLLVLVLPVIHDPANWRLRIGSHLHQVQSSFLGEFHGLFQRQDPKLFAVSIDDPNFWSLDVPIDVCFFNYTIHLL
jgi:hypothetical protein